MGFDMCVRALYLPADTPLNLAAAAATVRDLCRNATPTDMRLMLEEEWVNADGLTEPEDWTDEALTVRAETLRAATERRMLGLLHGLAESLRGRDVAYFRFSTGNQNSSALDTYLTGGPSFGEPLTDAYEAWDIVFDTERFPEGWPDQIGAACGLLHPRGSGPAVAAVTFHAWVAADPDHEAP